MAQSAQIQQMSAKHTDILNFILANPIMKLGDVAAHFSVTQSWLSTIIHSDAFQDQLQRRQDEIFDSGILQPIATKLTAAADATLETYMEKIPNLDADQLINASDKLLNRLGYGSQKNGKTVNVFGDVNTQVNNNHVSKEVLEEARNRIGTHKVGETNSPAALSDQTSQEGTEIGGMAIRAGSELEPI